MFLAQTAQDSVHFHVSPIGAIWGLVGIAFAIFILVDVLRHPPAVWQQAGQNRGLWIGLSILSFFCCGLIIGIVYLIAVRPKLERAASGYLAGGPPMGGYGIQGGYPPPGGYSPPGGYGPPPSGGYPQQPGGYPAPGGFAPPPPPGSYNPPPAPGFPPTSPPPESDQGWGQPGDGSQPS